MSRTGGWSRGLSVLIALRRDETLSPSMACVRQAPAGGAQGRPVALLVLLGLSVLNLSSEWPNDIARPAFLGALDAAVPDTFKSARQLLFDQYQRRFPRVPSSEPVTIVAIDEDTLARLGQWPWPRNRLASLIDAIAAQHPLAVGLGIYMPEPDQTSPDKVAGNLPKTAAALAAGLRALPSHEALLARSLRAAPTILGAVGFENAAFTTSTGLRTVPISVHGPTRCSGCNASTMCWPACRSCRPPRMVRRC